MGIGWQAWRRCSRSPTHLEALITKGVAYLELLAVAARKLLLCDLGGGVLALGVHRARVRLVHLAHGLTPPRLRRVALLGERLLLGGLLARALLSVSARSALLLKLLGHLALPALLGGEALPAHHALDVRPLA